MPLLQRVIEPVHVCRSTLPLGGYNGSLVFDLPNELECVTNGTLANIIRQLSSLSKHAEHIFSNLFMEITVLMKRTSSAQGRIDRLNQNVTRLDSNEEEVSLQDILMRKAFKSSVVYDQAVVSRDTMPTAMRDIYQTCDKPPPLDKLNPYREDGRDGVKFYTDPGYFFELWKQDMLKHTEKILHDKGKKPHRPRPDGKRHKKHVRQPHSTREKYRLMATAQEFDRPANYHPQSYGEIIIRQSSDEANQELINRNRPSSLDLYMPYDQESSSDDPILQYPPSAAYPEQLSVMQQQYPPPPSYLVGSPEHRGTPNSGTPTRQRGNSLRPSQPPPAPPVCSSSGSSGTSTPTVSASTPSSGAGRYRASSHSRDNLPPPPPPPEGSLVNGVHSNSYLPQVYHNQKVTQSGPNTPIHSLQQGTRSRHNTPTHHPHLMNHLPNSNGLDGSSLPLSNMTPDGLDLPPPPPIPDMVTAEDHQPPSPPPPPPPPPSVNGTNVLPPPPPPLPLPANGPVTRRVTDTRIQEVSLSSESASTGSSKTSDAIDGKGRLPAQGDARSDLLAAIREGIKLRRVEDIKQKEVEKDALLHDVASILARRVAMEFSDSDSASESEYDSEGWEDETSEC